MHYPALDVVGLDGGFALACVDECSPVAAEESDGRLTLFFATAAARASAQAALSTTFPDALVTPRDVDDEDWARRSQENLEPVTAGRITVVPPWRTQAESPSPPDADDASGRIRLVIRPSMAFGTGHHATTRLCLEALQTLDVAGKSVVDVGTGSGVLALAARALGAARCLGIDNDPDAISCARENLLLNPDLDSVTFDVADLEAGPEHAPPAVTDRLPADIVTANLTGALLQRRASSLLSMAAPGGALILSGILEDERDEVLSVFRNAVLVWNARQEEWLAVALRRPAQPFAKRS